MIYTEAKVGNWVLVPLDPEDETRTFPHKIVEKADPEIFIFEINEKRFYKSAENCHGMPITREWLLLNGFEYDEAANTYLIEDIKLEAAPNDQFFIFGFPRVPNMGRVTQHIHEFQKAYYEINGTEFPVKFTPYIS